MNNEQVPALRQAVESMATMREAYDNLSQAAEAYNVGKTQLAAAITSKGVETSPTESYPEMAEKVTQIPLETTIYEGADSYGKQIGAGGSLWDLYQVLAQMKTRFMGTGDYAALIVCEYYKGYDSLVLQGADGYYTCDGDYYDYASPNHIWHDDDNGKMNRWVAFLYRDEGARLDITNTSISPRSMYIGGHIGTIEYFVNGRLTDLVCGIEETDVLDNFIEASYTQSWNKNINIKAGHIDKITFSGQVFARIQADTITTRNDVDPFSGDVQYATIILGTHTNFYNGRFTSTTLVGIEIYGEFGRATSVYAQAMFAGNDLTFIRSYDLLYTDNYGIIGNSPNLIDLWCGEMTSNLRCGGWNPTNVLADAGKKAQLIENIKNHILARTSDRTGLSQFTFTVSTNMYNNIASETIEWHGETMTLADAFLTKNWLLAGA